VLRVAIRVRAMATKGAAWAMEVATQARVAASWSAKGATELGRKTRTESVCTTWMQEENSQKAAGAVWHTAVADQSRGFRPRG